MTKIVPLLLCLEPHLSSTTLCHSKHILFATLSILNRTTMLSLSRWMEKDGSYQTLYFVQKYGIKYLKGAIVDHPLFFCSDL